ncbi:MAG: ABC transporter permease [Spirochaetia bacterium]|jgi:simple sugar transport system permease protein|nr:ABC transporter permease [Spirochaetia bacterium]
MAFKFPGKSLAAREPSHGEGFEFFLRTAIPFLGVISALLISAIILLFLKTNPVVAYAAMFQGAFGSINGWSQSLVKATPLLLVGLGVCIAFRASVINVGGEGQIILGALAGTWFALTFPDLPRFVLIPGCMTAGFLAGAFWGLIPGFLKARYKVNEILSTIMMNSIALQFMNYLLQGPMMDPEGIAAGTFLAQSARLPPNSWLARLIPRTMLHSGVYVALIFAILVYVFLWRTTIGYQIRAVGLNPRASRYSGINVPFNQMLSLTIAGGLSGLAGVIEVMGVHRRILEGLTGGYGFTGIVAALLGSLHPLGIIPASVLFGGLLVGANTMQRAVQIPAALINAILGLIVLFVSGSALWIHQIMKKRKTAAIVVALPKVDAVPEETKS